MRCSRCNESVDELMGNRGAKRNDMWCVNCHAKDLMIVKVLASLVIPALAVIVWLVVFLN